MLPHLVTNIKSTETKLVKAILLNLRLLWTFNYYTTSEHLPLEILLMNTQKLHNAVQPIVLTGTPAPWSCPGKDLIRVVSRCSPGARWSARRSSSVRTWLMTSCCDVSSRRSIQARLKRWYTTASWQIHWSTPKRSTSSSTPLSPRQSAIMSSKTQARRNLLRLAPNGRQHCLFWKSSRYPNIARKCSMSSTTTGSSVNLDC